MFEGREQAEWNRVSALMALLANIWRAPRSRALSPADFNPYTQRQSVQFEADISVLKNVFVDRKR
jgi:hypothetical protein